jgi:hypothetical protein
MGISSNTLTFRAPTYGEDFLSYMRARQEMIERAPRSSSLQAAIKQRAQMMKNWRITKYCGTCVYTLDRTGCIIEFESKGHSNNEYHREYDPWSRRYSPELDKWDICERWACPPSVILSESERRAIAFPMNMNIGDDDDDDDGDDGDDEQSALDDAYEYGEDVAMDVRTNQLWVMYRSRHDPFINPARDLHILRPEQKPLAKAPTPPQTPPASPGHPWNPPLPHIPLPVVPTSLPPSPPSGAVSASTTVPPSPYSEAPAALVTLPPRPRSEEDVHIEEAQENRMQIDDDSAEEGEVPVASSTSSGPSVLTSITSNVTETTNSAPWSSRAPRNAPSSALASSTSGAAPATSRTSSEGIEALLSRIAILRTTNPPRPSASIGQYMLTRYLI